jgi:hypothetical protein
MRRELSLRPEEEVGRRWEAGQRAEREGVKDLGVLFFSFNHLFF